MRSIYKVIALIIVIAWMSCGGAIRRPVLAIKGSGLQRNQATVGIAIFCGGVEYGSGSGVIVGPHSVLSAAHLTSVCKDSTYQIETTDGKRYSVSAQRAWPEVDLAVFRIATVFPYAPVTKIGDPLEVEDGLCFHSGAPSRDVRCGQVESIRTFGPGNISHSAVVEPGNSGSPVFDLQGRLIGIITHYKKCQNGQLCGGRFSSIWNRKFVFAEVN